MKWFSIDDFQLKSSPTPSSLSLSLLTEWAVGGGRLMGWKGGAGCMWKVNVDSGAGHVTRVTGNAYSHRRLPSGRWRPADGRWRGLTGVCRQLTRVDSSWHEPTGTDAGWPGLRRVDGGWGALKPGEAGWERRARGAGRGLDDDGGGAGGTGVCRYLKRRCSNTWKRGRRRLCKYTRAACISGNIIFIHFRFGSVLRVSFQSGGSIRLQPELDSIPVRFNWDWFHLNSIFHLGHRSRLCSSFLYSIRFYGTLFQYLYSHSQLHCSGDSWRFLEILGDSLRFS